MADPAKMMNFISEAEVKAPIPGTPWLLPRCEALGDQGLLGRVTWGRCVSELWGALMHVSGAGGGEQEDAGREGRGRHHRTGQAPLRGVRPPAQAVIAGLCSVRCNCPTPPARGACLWAHAAELFLRGRTGRWLLLCGRPEPSSRACSPAARSSRSRRRRRRPSSARSSGIVRPPHYTCCPTCTALQQESKGR